MRRPGLLDPDRRDAAFLRLIDLAHAKRDR